MADFIPMVSNSPPPIDVIDDDDDFTDFTAANDNWESDEDWNSIPPPLPDTSDSDFDSPVKKVSPVSCLRDIIEANAPDYENSVDAENNGFQFKTEFSSGQERNSNGETTNDIEGSIKQNGEILSIVEAVDLNGSNYVETYEKEVLCENRSIPDKSITYTEVTSSEKVQTKQENPEISNSDLVSLPHDEENLQIAPDPSEDNQDANLQSNNEAIETTCKTINSELDDSNNKNLCTSNPQQSESYVLESVDMNTSTKAIVAEPSSKVQIFEEKSGIQQFDIENKSNLSDDASYLSNAITTETEDCKLETKDNVSESSSTITQKSEKLNELASFPDTSQDINLKDLQIAPTVSAESDSEDSFDDFANFESFSISNGLQNADDEPCEEAKSKTDDDFTELTKTSSNVNTNESAHDDFAEFVTSEHTTNTNINDVHSENATNTMDCVHTNDSINFDDFGDFGVVNNDSFTAEFKTVDFDPDNSETITTEIKSFQTTDNSNTTVDDEDFGTFENVNFTANFNEADLDRDENKAMQNKTNEITEQSDDYGNFATTANDSFVANFDETENDFGEFGSFEESSFPVQSSENHGISSEASLEKVFEQVSNLKLWFLGKDNIFERTDEDVTITETIRQVHDHIEDDVLDTFLQDNTASNDTTVNRPSQLWDLLEDVDNTIALKFKWNGSGHNRKLIKSLGIRTQNILFSGSSKPYYVPTYASGLGLLEPSKEMKPVSAAEKITAISPTNKVPPHTVPQYMIPSSNVNFPTSIEDTDQIWKTETGSSELVDACGVGVVTSSVFNSTSLDLDFLDKPSLPPTENLNPAHPEQDKVDPELLQLAMKITPDANPKKPDPLSKILASLGVASSKKMLNNEDEDVSEKGRKIIEKLPDLSFMRSTVLMFPIQSKVTTE